MYCIAGNLPLVSKNGQKFSGASVEHFGLGGHCLRAKGETIFPLLVFWKPADPNHYDKLTYPRIISRETGSSGQFLRP